MNCIGPCLQHCHKKNSIILFLIGVIIGFIISRASKKKN